MLLRVYKVRVSRAARSSLRRLSSLSFSPHSSYVGGQWVQGSRYDVINPATNAPVASVHGAGVADAQAAIDAAQAAFPAFAATPARARAELLLRIHHLLLEHIAPLAELITLENGKPLADARGEIQYAAAFFQWFAEEAPRLYGAVIPSASASKRIVALKQPVGPVGIITPWNFPQAMYARKVAAAIAAGCTSVIKPDSLTPLSAFAFARICHDAGVPAGVVNVVATPPDLTPAVGRLLCESPALKKILFTGSTPVGKLLMLQLALTLKKMSLELGGNAPFIVLADADIDAAVAGAMASKFRLLGQTCVCTNRVYLHDSVYDEFTTKFVAAVQQTVLGNGMDPATTHGPVINAKAIARMEEMVGDAQRKGAAVLTGGSVSSLGPNFFPLTVLGNCTNDMLVALHEIFGPIAPLFRFSTEEEAVALANGPDGGLAGYVFTSSGAAATRLSEALDVGMVGVNTGGISEAALPFGGVGESGFGREGSLYGIEEYQVVKGVVTQL